MEFLVKKYIGLGNNMAFSSEMTKAQAKAKFYRIYGTLMGVAVALIIVLKAI